MAVRPSSSSRNFKEQLVFGFRVQGAGGFVQDDDLGVAEKGPGEGDFLPLADAQLLPAVKQISKDRFIPVFQPADDRMSIRQAGSG